MEAARTPKNRGSAEDIPPLPPYIRGLKPPTLKQTCNPNPKFKPEAEAQNLHLSPKPYVT